MNHDTAKGMGEKEIRQQQSQMEAKMKDMNGVAGNPGVDITRPGDRMGDGAVGGGEVMTGLEREMKRVMGKMMGGM